ncbi:MAG: hypothetical protein Q7S81_02680 [bacterium]|nr:hypothetical protein [bacterium]
MQLELSEKWVSKLLRMPESGMGYQVVDITLKDGSVLKNRTVVLPYLYLLSPGEIKEEDIVKIEIS